MVQKQMLNAMRSERAVENTEFCDLGASIRQLLLLASGNSELREHLRLVAYYALQLIDGGCEGGLGVEGSLPANTSWAENSITTDDDDGAATDVPTQAPIDAYKTEITLGQSSQGALPLVDFTGHREVEHDLGVVVARCLLKAEASRWVVQRQDLMVGGAGFSNEIDPMDRELIAKAKSLPDCFLWMCHLRESPTSNRSQFEELADCFDTLAQAALLVLHLRKECASAHWLCESALRILAEAQSALRVAVGSVSDKSDIDQMAVFGWLRQLADRESIYIPRYMKVADPAAPEMAREMLTRISELRATFEESQRKQRRRLKLLGKVRHKAALIQRDPQDREGNWQILADTVAELLADGLPASNRELREFLVSIIDLVPDVESCRERLEPVLIEIHRHRERESTPNQHASAEPTAEVKEAARRLRNGSLVIIGGDRRPNACRAIKEAFGLKDLDWIKTRPHQSFQRFESHIARTGVTVVVLAIRWASHSFGGVKKFCRRYNVPFVRLPGGYSPNQLAEAILEQCGWQAVHDGAAK